VIATAEDAAIIRQALSLLSPAERAAIVMWEIDGRSSLEISRELGINESAVRHTVSRARSSLRRILTDLIIDEERGLTALDLLSVSYRKSVKAVKSSSRAVLSLALIVIAFLGFNSLPVGKISPVIEAQDTLTSLRLQTPELPINSEGIAGSDSMEISSPKQNLSTKIRTSRETFLGLDKKGLPKGFTVSDSTGSLGSAYFMERDPLVIENGVASRQLIKTDTGAANIFISQTLWTDEHGLSYDPIVSFGQSGQWIPLVTRLLSQEIERQSDGNYLLTANIGVDYEAESALKIKAKAGGRDLSTPPSKLVTRLVLDPTKTNVLAQAVFVVEKGA
jgi:DNA-binding CsgD family transcriptional regulator